MDAIYGELFELGPKGKIINDLATGYSFSDDAKTITLRPGVQFTDGTPFNAAAVVWNIQRDLKSACTCKPTWQVKSVTASGPYSVQIALTQPDGAFIYQIFDSTADWIASPTAVQKTGEKTFAVKPVGAGPFEMVSDTLSSVLVLKKNPGYWQKGLPYLDSLTFKTVGSDEAAYEAMLAGQGQVYEDMSTPSLPRPTSRRSCSTSSATSILNLGALVGAVAIIEPIFSLPGVGAILIQSIDNHDVPVVEGIVVVFAVVVVPANLLADLLYAVLDPRIRYERPAA